MLGARDRIRGPICPSAHPPTTHLRKVYFDTVAFTRHQLQELVRLYGPHHVLMGTDYPFDMANYDPLGYVRNAGLDEEAVATICGGNAKRLLGF